MKEETTEEDEERFTMIILNLIEVVDMTGLARKEFSG
jgi:predicted DNA-binding transcriptional regulator AlpA